MQFSVKSVGKYKYIEEGEGETLLLLHGLFGALSNWDSVVNFAAHKYRVIIPMLPIYDMPIRSAKLEGLVDFVEKFIEAKQIKRPHLFGNSLGGHLALLYTLKHQENVRSLILTGSSGLFETSMGGSYPKRGDYEYIRNLTAYTFYNPAFATKELVDEIFEVTKSIPQCLRMVSLAKSAQRNNLGDQLHKIKVPALLIWGLNDTITPPTVAHDFNRLLVNSRLRFIDHCCHAPMMEHPDMFNKYFFEYLGSLPADN